MNQDLIRLGMAYTYKQAGYTDEQAVKMAAGKFPFTQVFKGFGELARPNLPAIRGKMLPATVPYKPNFTTGNITPAPKVSARPSPQTPAPKLLAAAPSPATQGPASPTPLKNKLMDLGKKYGPATAVAGGYGAGVGGLGYAAYDASKATPGPSATAGGPLPLKPLPLEQELLDGAKPNATEKAKALIKSIMGSKLGLGAGLGGAAGLAAGALTSDSPDANETDDERKARQRSNMLRSGALAVGGAGAGMGLAKLMEALKAKG